MGRIGNRPALLHLRSHQLGMVMPKPGGRTSSSADACGFRRCLRRLAGRCSLWLQPSGAIAFPRFDDDHAVHPVRETRLKLKSALNPVHKADDAVYLTHSFYEVLVLAKSALRFLPQGAELRLAEKLSDEWFTAEIQLDSRDSPS